MACVYVVEQQHSEVIMADIVEMAFKKVKLEILRPGSQDPEYRWVLYVNLHQQLNHLVGKGFSTVIQQPIDRDHRHSVIAFNKSATEKNHWMSGPNARGVIVFFEKP